MVTGGLGKVQLGEDASYVLLDGPLRDPQPSSDPGVIEESRGPFSWLAGLGASCQQECEPAQVPRGSARGLGGLEAHLRPIGTDRPEVSPRAVLTVAGGAILLGMTLASWPARSHPGGRASPRP